jgi:hypothetical protein
LIYWRRVYVWEGRTDDSYNNDEDTLLSSDDSFQKLPFGHLMSEVDESMNPWQHTVPIHKVKLCSHVKINLKNGIIVVVRYLKNLREGAFVYLPSPEYPPPFCRTAKSFILPLPKGFPTLAARYHFHKVPANHDGRNGRAFTS